MIRAKTTLAVKRNDIFICMSPPLYLEQILQLGFIGTENHVNVIDLRGDSNVVSLAYLDRQSVRRDPSRRPE
jgi:hypothetical protein